MKLIDGQKDGSAENKDTLEKIEQGFKTRRAFSTVHYVLGEPSETLDDIRNGFPNFGTINSSAYLKGVMPQEIGTVIDPETGDLAVLYEVTTEYDSSFAQDNDDDKLDRDNPPDTLPKRRWYSEKEEEDLEVDADTGKPIVTGCNEKIIVPHKVSVYVLEITRYEDPTVKPQEIKREYENTRNEQPFYDFPTGDGVMDEIDFDEEWIEDSNHIRRLWLKATYRIKFRHKEFSDEGWDVVLLHEGYLFKPKAGMNPRLHLDEETKQPTKVLLKTDPDSPNFHGVILEEGGDPNYLRFKRFPKKDWSPLGLEY